LLLLLPWLVASPSSAQTETREFFVDPFQSFVQIDGTSALILDLPAPLGSTSLTLLPQSDPGVSGGVLPGVGATDGRVTTLEGGFYLAMSLPTAPGLVGTMAGGEASRLFSVSDSGSWLPGDLAGARPGQLAAEVGLPGLGLAAEIVVRDLAFSGFDAGGVSYVDDDHFTFPAQPVLLDPVVGTQAVSGLVELSGLGFRGGVFVPESALTLVVPADSGTLERLGANDWRLFLPIVLQVDFVPRAPLAATLELDLHGQIVATTVPEPGLGVGLAMGLFALAVLARRSGRRPPGSDFRARVALGIVLLASMPGCPRIESDWEDLDEDGTIELVELASYAPGEGAGSTASATNDDVLLEIEETGQVPITASCSTGTCPSNVTVASACGTIDQAAESTGMRIDLADGCTALTTYRASGTLDQLLFNQSGIDKTFLVTLRRFATSPSSLTTNVTANGSPLVAGVPLAIVASPGPALNLSLSYSFDYVATGPGDEVANVSIEVSTPRGLCQNDLECGADGACIAGTCITAAPGSFCLSHADCDTTGLPCNGTFSRCQAPSLWPNPCGFDWDCEGRCFSGTCSEGLLNHGCLVDEDCDASAPICSGGFCST